MGSCESCPDTCVKTDSKKQTSTKGGCGKGESATKQQGTKSTCSDVACATDDVKPINSTVCKRCKSNVITRNPFLNFLIDFRKCHPDLTAVQVTVQGGHMWNNLCDKEKQPYRNIALTAPVCKRKRKRLEKRCSCNSKKERRKKKMKKTTC